MTLADMLQFIKENPASSGKLSVIQTVSGAKFIGDLREADGDSAVKVDRYKKRLGTSRLEAAWVKHGYVATIDLAKIESVYAIEPDRIHADT